MELVLILLKLWSWIFKNLLILFWIASNKNKKGIYLGNIVHGVGFNPIKTLDLIIQKAVDTDLNSIWKNKKGIYLGHIVDGVGFDPIKILDMIIKKPVDTDSNSIWQKQKRYLHRKHCGWSWFWSYQNFGHDYPKTCLYWFK